MAKKLPRKPTRFTQYRNGGDGFVKWCEEYVHVPIYPEGSDVPYWCPLSDLPTDPHPETGRSYQDMWSEQKDVLRRALEMKNGRFRYRLIVLCWPRGDGKSLIAVLVQLWKFFNWPKQQIMLGANSRDQVKFVHFDIMRDIIWNSPKLFALVGKKNIQEKEIRLKNRRNQIVSIIRTISSFSGIVSNITGYTFSEIFDMKNPKFFVQLDGSTRNIPNALGVIDSTVSTKTHVLYKLFLSYQDGKDSSLFFHYRFSLDGKQDEYWNPHMVQTQLDSYRSKFPMGDFERYFLNLWSAGAERVFTDAVIEATQYLGADGVLGNHSKVLEVIDKRNRLLVQMDELEERGVDRARLEIDKAGRLNQLYSRLRPIETVYALKTKSGIPRMATSSDLELLGELYDTDWAILLGLDRADPMKISSGARTILTCIAKGLPQSNTHYMVFDSEGAVPRYLYVVLHVADLVFHSLEEMKQIIGGLNSEFDGIDMVCAERWGTWDLAAWCEENDIPFEVVFPTYDRQKAAFSEFFIVCQEGRFKMPSLAVPGSREGDIVREEMVVFDHDIDKRWFGSPEKGEKYGIQDDSMFSIGWALYGGRNVGLDQFRSRRGIRNFGDFFANKELVGAW